MASNVSSPRCLLFNILVLPCPNCRTLYCLAEPDWSIIQAFARILCIFVRICNCRTVYYPQILSAENQVLPQAILQELPPNKRTAWCVIDEGGITSAVVGTDEENWSWHDIVHFAQNGAITLLYVSEKKFIFIPTNALSMDQRAELLGYVDRHVRSRRSC